MTRNNEGMFEAVPDKFQYRISQAVYTFSSMAIVLLSVIVFIMDTMPVYRLRTSWTCTFANVTDPQCYLGSNAFEWNLGIPVNNLPYVMPS